MTNLRFKVIACDFNPDTGRSYVKIATRFGNFIGRAETDEDNPSNFLGCEIAENRAVIKAYQAYIKMNKNYKKALERIYQELKETRTFHENNFQMQLIQKRIKWYEGEIADSQEVCDFLKKDSELKVRYWMKLRQENHEEV